LGEYVQAMENRLFGLTAKDTRKLAYGFNREDKLVGLDWLKGFLDRLLNCPWRYLYPRQLLGKWVVIRQQFHSFLIIASADPQTQILPNKNL
jgi:hypothetical protein